MPRPENALSPDDGPVPAFAVELRRLRADAGRPTYRAMAKRCHYGHTTLSEAAAGRRFPSWEVTRAYVIACDGDLDEWRRRWCETADQVGDGDEDGGRSPSRGSTRISGAGPVPVDPGRAGTLPELMSMLDDLRGQAGLSLRQLVERSWDEADRGAGTVLPNFLGSEYLQGRRSPRAEDVLRIVELCGGTAADLRRWATACDRLLPASDDREAVPGSGRPADPDPPGGPRELRLMLGTRLRSLREARGISTEKAGHEIRASHSKISRMELGRVGFKERDVADLLTLYGISDPAERASLLELARRAKIPNWWQRFGDVLPSWFEVYLGMEEAASLVRTYEVQLVPGLLQTEDYARAVARRGYPPASEEEVEQRLQVRAIRQRRVASGGRLGGAESPRVWAVLDEAVFYRPIGDRSVMRGQIEHLIEVTGQPGFSVQVLPRDAGLYPTGGSFTILRFADQSLSDVVYLEQLAGATFLDRPTDVELYKCAMDNVGAAASQPDDTAEVLTRILRDI
ncbi:XRE family transcriptional regulator [Actinomadura sp. KC216]|uniref:helix-turn-helix domain-containing protein n=1 Tax=Actinomadura sp. KC216 TaxID=2530370 RepID=UPI0010495B8C|nr:helix-turn-helix transcriptional regulator [Actinomadura sp. KC216]TDB87607.1 XRE family transcriptional regulator [Actinomadura sp. KC216]